MDIVDMCAAPARATLRHHPDTTILEICGDLRGADQEPLRDAFRHALSVARRRPGLPGAPLTLDFSRVDDMDSSGIAVLVDLIVEARREERGLRCAGLSPHWRKIFDLMGLLELAPLAPLAATGRPIAAWPFEGGRAA